ncbi:MBL fold metallo-hydrolase [Paracoccus cavernae]|uniref:MBL fold metallo-hydrolase n=1 Tax=Paracoccus cavernae TaxID=1571207 RepID=UPI00363786CC
MWARADAGPAPGSGGIGRVDAIFLSHAHIDHVGAIDLWPELGRPPVYATRATFDALPLLGLHLPPEACRDLPLQGPARLLDLPVTVGRNGHAMGGIWLHLPAEGGALYMGDWSRESGLLPFDPPSGGSGDHRSLLWRAGSDTRGSGAGAGG